MTGDAAGMELAASVKVFGSETAVDVINRLIQVIGVQAYDPRNKVLAHMLDAMVYPIFEGSNIGVRRRQLQEIMVAEGWNPLASSGMQ